MIDFVFLDLDDTVLDFHRSEAIAIRETFREVGIEPTDETVALYSRINRSCWEKMETGELTREEVLTRRFDILSEKLGIPLDSQRTQKIYEYRLGCGHFFTNGALDVVRELSEKYRLFAATNGIVAVQSRRIESAGIAKYFENIFISELIGHNKPSVEFFDYAFGTIDGFQKSRAIIVGDSLTSDIKGGINAGILTCYYNPSGRKNDTGIHPDYEISDICELPELLKKI